MKKLSDKEIARALSQRGTPEHPPGLARQIKAEIPGQLEVGGGAFEPAGRSGAVRFGGLRPLWLIAASLLMVVGAGFVAVRLLTPPADLSREIALGGVTMITDVVVTVPERGTVDTQKLAKAENRVSKAAPRPARPAAADLVAARTVSRELEAKAKGEERLEPGKADARAAEQEALPASVPASEAAPATASKVLLAVVPPRETVTLVVRTAVGATVAGVPVSLLSLEKKDATPLEGVTGADGAVAFAAVPPGRYRATARPAGGSAVVLEPLDVPEGQSRTFELRLPPTLP
jgi:hypothetical protein